MDKEKDFKWYEWLLVIILVALMAGALMFRIDNPTQDGPFQVDTAGLIT